MKGGPQDIIVGQVLDDAIFDFFVRCFWFKRPEHPVPDDENAGIVAVQIAGISGVVDAVVRGCVHHRFKPAGHPVNRFGMDPVLIDQIQPGEKKDQCRRKPQKEQRHPEEKAEREKAGPCLTQRGGQVIVLAAVMNDMRCPEPADAVRGAVEPVIGQIIQNKCNRHQPQRLGPSDLQIDNPVVIGP